MYKSTCHSNLLCQSTCYFEQKSHRQDNNTKQGVHTDYFVFNYYF